MQKKTNGSILLFTTAQREKEAPRPSIIITGTKGGGKMVWPITSWSEMDPIQGMVKSKYPNAGKKQIQGAHAGNMSYNRVAIGICLVGDFENEGVPTPNQFESTARLVQYLSRRYSVPMSRIIMHKQVAHKCTACPAKISPLKN